MTPGNWTILYSNGPTNKARIKGYLYGVEVCSVRFSHSIWHLCTYYVQAIRCGSVSSLSRTVLCSENYITWWGNFNKWWNYQILSLQTLSLYTDFIRVCYFCYNPCKSWVSRLNITPSLVSTSSSALYNSRIRQRTYYVFFQFGILLWTWL